MKISKNIIIGGIVAIAIIVGVLIYFIFGSTKPVKLFSVEAKTADITEKINLSGQVKSSQGVDLAFVVSGKIVANYVKAGDKIYAGQTLAVLDQSSARATLTSAQGSLAQVQANYDKLINGASQNDIQSLQDAVNSSKVNANSAYNSALSALNNGYTAIFNAEATAKVIQDTYFRSADSSWGPVHENEANIINKLAIAKDNINQISAAGITDLIISNISNSLSSVLTSLQIIRDQTNTDSYISSVSVADKAALDSQKSAVSSALSSVSTLQGSIASSNASLQTAMHNSEAKQSAPRQEDVDLAQAQVLSAQGQVDSARAVLNNTVLSAPFSGQVDKDNVVAGSIASPNVPVITISNDTLEIDTYIPEINLSGAKIGSKANVTLDAFGNSVIFPSTVVLIDLAPTIVNGVSVYSAKLKFDSQDERIKTGMTANIAVISDTHANILTVPVTAVIQNNNEYFVIVDKGNGQKETRKVTTGLSDGTDIEIISGLKPGEKVFAY